MILKLSPDLRVRSDSHQYTLERAHLPRAGGELAWRTIGHYKDAQGPLKALLDQKLKGLDRLTMKQLLRKLDKIDRDMVKVCGELKNKWGP